MRKEDVAEELETTTNDGVEGADLDSYTVKHLGLYDHYLDALGYIIGWETDGGANG